MNGFSEAVLGVRRMLEGGPALRLAPGAPAELRAGVGAVVQTSGSSGAGRLVVLSRAALLAAAAASRQRLGADLTWHLALAPHYVAGLMVLVRSLAGGRQPVPAAGDLSDLEATGDGDAVSIVPTQLHRALADPRTSGRLARFDAVLVGGAALAPDLRGRALDAGVRVIETYGMSETCGGCVWDGVPLPGVDVRILPHEKAPEGSGCIALAGPMLFDGYLGDPAATARALADGALLTSDFGRFADGHLTVGGRLDDVVITGGVNVDLAEVRRAVGLLDPDAAVLAVPDAEWGVRIVLFSHLGDLGWWRGELDLPRTSLPRQFVRVNAVPRTAGGKPDRAKLLALVES